MNYKTTKQWFCLFALLLLGSVNTFAQKLTISDATIKAGETAELTISLMSGEVTVYGIQTDIVLPEGLTMAKPKNVETSLVDEDYEATVSFNKNNNRLILTSMDGIAFKTETAVATFKVTAAENFVNQDGAIVSINTKNTKFTTSTTGTEVNATEEAAAKVEAEYYAYTIPATISFEGASVGTGICTYAKDVKEGQVSQMQAVNNWTIVSNGDARAAGVFALGSDAFLGGEGILPPAADINGVTTGNVLGLCGVWTGAAQYTQNLKLAAGQYYIIVPVYNAAGAEALSQNNIGFFADNGVAVRIKTFEKSIFPCF